MYLINLVLAVAALSPSTYAWLPYGKELLNADGHNLFGNGNVDNDTVIDSMKRQTSNRTPIRGVNLGSLFIIEPWMAASEWSSMGCGNSKSEYDCVSVLGQTAANALWAKHWASWITLADIQKMASYSLNTIRIPLGYWIFESIKYRSEHFPEGALTYLGNIVDWAADQGFFIILDFHGTPFAQDAQQPFTGQYVSAISNASPAFYQSSQYERAYWFLGNLTHLVHTDQRYRNVGMLEVVNEPMRSSDLTNSMRQEYYPNAYATIRNVERSLDISPQNALHVQMMDAAWGSGDPTEYLNDTHSTAYDDHNYIGFSNTPITQSSYLQAACSPRGGNSPMIVGEWSLIVGSSTTSAGWSVGDNKRFYQQFFVKQARTYEQQLGWVFWSWKTNLGDPRWDYSAAVAAGIIPTNLDSMDASPC